VDRGDNDESPLKPATMNVGCHKAAMCLRQWCRRSFESSSVSATSMGLAICTPEADRNDVDHGLKDQMAARPLLSSRQQN
jgi:hypothetical protein